jgi:hypothetical protein
MRRLTGVVLGGALLAGGCGGSVTSPTPARPLRFTVEQTPTFVGTENFATFTVRVENISQAVVDLTFPSSCRILPQFETRNGQPVTPLGGGFACATVITNHPLRAGEGFAQVITVKAGTAPEAQAIVLPPGDYRLVARLDDTVYRLNSEPLPFSVR